MNSPLFSVSRIKIEPFFTGFFDHRFELTVSSWFSKIL